ncbi:hypothetical protein [Motilibacter deserti]|uniref:Uncharacterized protein n=1 Tax=Motilibacter deserti TaxID=2714956 RepID=A0ABX0GXJ1_9ACTN|nr:hypothetical protein [Motilibacter deserti]NHC14330.1 hypothetical protein [Motilibacter deserti]
MLTMPVALPVSASSTSVPTEFAATDETPSPVPATATATTSGAHGFLLVARTE